jgi:hypothetical protein
MLNLTQEVTWIDVKEDLPVIPEDKYAVQVWAAVYDRHYSEDPNKNYDVYTVTYTRITENLLKELAVTVGAEGYELGECMFISFASGPKGSCIVPVFDEITHWMYLPTPPIFES